MSMENKYNMKGCLSEAFCVQNWSKHDLWYCRYRYVDYRYVDLASVRICIFQGN
jgi:hypothetical protein